MDVKHGMADVLLTFQLSPGPGRPSVLENIAISCYAEDGLLKPPLESQAEAVCIPLLQGPNHSNQLQLPTRYRYTGQCL